MKRVRTLFVVIVTMAIGSTVALAHPPAGPKWEEMMDAGNLPAFAQPTMGMGTLSFINGNLGGTISSGELIDFEDMFIINIVDPAMFRATTDEMDGELGNAFATFDTMLWLFQPGVMADDAFGIVGNNDHPNTGSLQSLLTPITDDGHAGVVTPGLYYLAITRFNNVPQSAGLNIFDLDTRTEISGPDGFGGLGAIDGWSGDGELFVGDYRISLRGVEFSDIPAPGTICLLGLAVLGNRKRRRR
ncbi:MAG: hypothetical protein IH984_10540 [Planctomycetes bacterium]|nr:hypothetical protein [Planctomycetota bacterium]